MWSAYSDVARASWYQVFLPLAANNAGSGDMVLVPAGTFQMGCDPAHSGGGWHYNDGPGCYFIRVAYRDDGSPTALSPYIGFRCVAAP